MEQRTDEWFEARKNKITASVVGAILGLSPHMTRTDVMRQMVRAKHGAPREFNGNVATEYGTRYEPQAIAEYELETGNKVDPCGFFMDEDWPWLGASPDGLIGDDTLLEVKCPYNLRDGGEFSQEIPPHYYAQMQIQMFCADRNFAHFYQWSPRGTSLQEVEIDHKWLYDNLSVLKKFYNEFLSIQDPTPYLEDKRVIQNGNQTLNTLVDEYINLGMEIKRLEEKKKDLLQTIVAGCDEKDSDINGHKLTKVCKEGAISYAKAVKDLLPNSDLTPYQAKPTEYWLLK